MIRFLKRLAADVATPAADKVTLFVDTTGNAMLKDETGATSTVGGGVPLPAVAPTAGQVLSATDDDPLTTDWIDPSGSGTNVWADYVPTLTQSGAVTKTVTRARYLQNGKTVTVAVRLVVTGTGTGANIVTVTVPVTALNAGPHCGVGVIYDSSAALTYTGVAKLATTTTISFVPTNSTTSNDLGAVSFVAGLASGDIIDFTATYEAA